MHAVILMDVDKCAGSSQIFFENGCRGTSVEYYCNISTPAVIWTVEPVNATVPIIPAIPSEQRVLIDPPFYSENNIVIDVISINPTVSTLIITNDTLFTMATITCEPLGGGSRRLEYNSSGKCVVFVSIFQ